MQFDLHLFCKHQLLLTEINHAMYFSQSQLLLGKRNEDRTACQKTLYACSLFIKHAYNVFTLFHCLLLSLTH